MAIEHQGLTIEAAGLSTSSSAASRFSGGAHRWLMLVAVLIGSFMVTLDFFIVNVSIPSLQADLLAGRSDIEWIIAGYGIALAAGLITGGRLGDLYGLRRMFTYGLIDFTIASAICGLAPDPAILIAARVAQGLASALMLPQVLAIIGVAYRGSDRMKAFAIYGTALGLGSVCGQLIGGLLIAANPMDLGWRSCFLVNIPMGLIALGMVRRYVPAFRSEGASRLDLTGAALVAAGLVATVLPLIEGGERGWPVWTWIVLAMAAVLLAVFAQHQRRLAKDGQAPLVHPYLFRERAFTAGLFACLVFYAGVASYFLVLALYLQQGRGLSPLDAGAVFTMMAVGYFATTNLAPRLVRRLGRQTLAIGALTMVAGLGLQAWAVLDQPGDIMALLPGLLIDGAGMGLVMAPMSAMILADVSPHYAGAAAGVLATAQQVASAIGVALIGLVFYGSLSADEAGAGFAPAFTDSLAFLIVLSVAVAALVQFLPRRKASEA